jgi:GNAT superfamily N-acetyltransferase
MDTPWICLRTDSTHPDFQALVRQLDRYLAEIDGDEHGFYAQYNTIATLGQVVVAYAPDGQPVGCGAIKPIAPGCMEVKRMYVVPQARGRGVAGQVLAELERWSLELGCPTCVLETGRRQPEAIGLYEKHGYQRTANYGQYVGVANSVCFAKSLA